MFAMHNSFRSQTARRLALNGIGVFKPAALVARDLHRSQGIFYESGNPQHHDWCHVKSVGNSQGEYIFACLVPTFTSGQNGYGVNFATCEVVEKQFGPYLPDDLILVAVGPIARPVSLTASGLSV